MSYWTYTDLFEERGPPTAPFQGGFGLRNSERIRKPAYFAYKYPHALDGDSVAISDSQAVVSTKDGNICEVVWDFEQPDQKVSNRSFCTKVLPNYPAKPVRLEVTHFAAGARYRLRLYRTDYHANDAYTAYVEMGAPKQLTAELASFTNVPGHLPALTLNRFGKGNALYLAMESNASAMTAVESTVLQIAGIQRGPATLDGVFARVVDDRMLYVNTTGEQRKIPADGSKRGILTNRIYNGTVVLGPSMRICSAINSYLSIGLG